jgi:hypothetical protein
LAGAQPSVVALCSACRQLVVRLLKTHGVELLLNKRDLTRKVQLLAVGTASRLDRVYELKMSMWTQFDHKHSLTLQRLAVTVCSSRCHIQNLYVLPTQLIYLFCADLRTNSDYFPTQR